MRLEDMTVVARSRNLGEVHDLALLLLRRHALVGGLLATVGCAPWIVLNWWLTGLMPTPQAACWLLAVLTFAQAPLACAPLTAFLGQAMFDRAPRLRTSLDMAVRASPTLLLAGLWRGFCAVTVLPLLWSAAHLGEVALLERQSGWSAWKRAHQLANAGLGAHLLHLVIGAITVVAAIWILDGTVHAFTGLLRNGVMWADREPSDWLPGHHLLPTFALYLAMGYLAAARFCAYIDLRTRHEGWDVELDLRRAGDRVRGGPA
jgi:hypothetical protein